MKDLFLRVTTRTILENTINDLYASKYFICNKAISVIVDNPDVFPKQEIIIWLVNKNSLESDLEIVDYFISELHFAAARKQLESLDEKYHMNSEQKVELHYFTQVKEAQITMKQQGFPIDKLSHEIISILEPVALASKGLGGDQARALLNQNGYDYFIPPVFPARRSIQQTETDLPSIAHKKWESHEEIINLLSAAPNPASSELQFTFELWENKPGFIILRDHLGNLKAKLQVNEKSGTIRWSCESLSSGAYFYSFETNGQLLIEPKSILIIK